jgi:hypothetical protein
MITFRSTAAIGSIAGDKNSAWPPTLRDFQASYIPTVVVMEYVRILNIGYLADLCLILVHVSAYGDIGIGTEATIAVLLSPRPPGFRRAEGGRRKAGARLEVERRIPTDWEMYNMPDWAYGN